MNAIDINDYGMETDHREPEAEDGAEALATIEPELGGVEPRTYVRMNVDVPRAIRIGFGSVGRLRPFRERIAELPGIGIAKIDKLEVYALAAWYANGLAKPSTSSEGPFQELVEEAVPLRRTLLLGAEALADFGYFPADKVADIKAGKGFLDTANDCGALAGLYREHWDTIEGKTPVTREEVDRAAVVGWRLLKALGADGAETVPLKTTERRVQAFTLFVDAYEEARRAVSYLRWHEGDADMIAPTLFSRSRRRPSNETADDAASATEPAPPEGPSPEPA